MRTRQTNGNVAAVVEGAKQRTEATVGSQQQAILRRFQQRGQLQRRQLMQTQVR